MIGLDTNVVVRYIMQDDPVQSKVAATVIGALTADEPGFVSLVTVVELVWVLESAYDLPREQVAAAIAGLLVAREIVVDRAEVIGQALRLYRAGKPDFADALIERIGRHAGCERTVSFDAKAVRDAGMSRCASPDP